MVRALLVLALLAHSTTALASGGHHGGGGGGGGGHHSGGGGGHHHSGGMSGGHHHHSGGMSGGHHHHHTYGGGFSPFGYWPYGYGFGYPYGYSRSGYYGSNARSYAPRRIVAIRQPSGTATITNPSATAVRYRLNEFDYTIEPGQVQTVTLDRDWVVEFQPTSDTTKVDRYTLVPGLHKFAEQDGQTAFYRVVAPAVPVQPAATSPAATTVPAGT